MSSFHTVILTDFATQKAALSPVYDGSLGAGKPCAEILTSEVVVECAKVCLYIRPLGMLYADALVT